MFYYICMRCGHITNQKIEMKRHLSKNKKCVIIDKNNLLSDEELYELSLEKHDKLNDIKIGLKNDIINDYCCTICNKKFSNKGNLNKHCKNICNKNNITFVNTNNNTNKDKYIELNNKNGFTELSKSNENDFSESKSVEKIYNVLDNNQTSLTTNNTTNNIQNIGVQHITNINISLNMIKGFDEEWDISQIDHQKKGEILLSNSKFTKTLENILKNDTNLNVILGNKDEHTGIVYSNEKNKYEPMKKEKIIQLSMKKVYNHLQDFYKEIINNNTDDLSIQSLENELKIFEQKYTDFLKFEDAKNIVNNTFSKLYDEKKEEAENVYYTTINSNLIDGY